MYRFLAVDLLHDVNKAINKENIVLMCDAIGASYANEEIEQVIDRLDLDNKSLDEWAAEGMKKMCAVSASAPAPVTEEKKEEPKEEPKAAEEEDDDFDMFSGF